MKRATDRQAHHRRMHARGRIEVNALKGREVVADLIDNHFNAYNAARVWEICHLLKDKVMRPRVTVGLSLSGAMIPAGLASSLIPLIDAIAASAMSTPASAARRTLPAFMPLVSWV